MAILVNSWPAGIAVSLLTLPLIGTSSGIGAVHLAVAAFIAFGVVLLALLYQPPPDAPAASTAAARLDRSAAFAVLAAGLIWGLFNVGFAMIFSFGPSMLVERGWSIAAAGSAHQHRVVDRRVLRPVRRIAGRPNRPAANHSGHSAALVFAALMITAAAHAAPSSQPSSRSDCSAGQPAGPIMSLPARVLQPATRAIGMGLFFTVFYGCMMLGPVVGGAFAKWTGSAAAAFDFGAAMILMCPAAAVGVQPDRGGRGRRAARLPPLDATVANHSLTLSALGSVGHRDAGCRVAKMSLAHKKSIHSGRRGAAALPAGEGAPARPLHAARPARISLPDHQYVARRPRSAGARHRQCRRPRDRLSRPYRPGRGQDHPHHRQWLCHDAWAPPPASATSSPPS